MSSKQRHLGLKSSLPTISVTADQDTYEWFHDAKERTESRVDRQLTHEEFTRILLDVFEFHEDTEIAADDIDAERNEYVGSYKQCCRECDRRFTAAGDFCPYCGTSSPGVAVPPTDEDETTIVTDGGIDPCTGDTECAVCGTTERPEKGWIYKSTEISLVGFNEDGPQFDAEDGAKAYCSTDCTRQATDMEGSDR